VAQLYPRHRVPILVASYDTHGLRWDYSFSPVTTLGLRLILLCTKIHAHARPVSLGIAHCILTTVSTPEWSYGLGVRSGQASLLLTVSRSVRFGLEPLIVTHGHILTWKKISILSFVGRPPWRVVGADMYRGHSLVCVMWIYVLSPCDSIIKNYTEIFHLFCKRNVPPLPCKLSPDQCASVREADDRNLTLFGIYLPAFTPRLPSTQATLQRSENVSLLGFCGIRARDIAKEG
jgi:hypothetical protein